jgi:hypothetical protein
MIGFKKILQRFRSRRIANECPRELQARIEALEKEFLAEFMPPHKSLNHPRRDRTKKDRQTAMRRYL